MRPLVLALLLLLSATASAQAAGQGQSPARTRITWLGHAAFLIQTPGGANLLVDPWLQNPNAPQNVQLPQKIDAVLVSHGHADHVGQAKNWVNKEGTRLLAANELSQLLGSKEMGGNIGGTFEVKDARIHFVEAVHSSSYAAGEGQAAQYAGTPMGFVIEIRNGPTLYHAGDTAYFEGMRRIGSKWKPSVALLPIGGHFTMDPADAVDAVAAVGAATVIPMHYGTFPLLQGTPDQLRQALSSAGSKAKVQVLEPGKAATF